MDTLTVAIRLSETYGNDNPAVAIVVVIRIFNAVEQTTLIEGLAGNITGSLYLAILGIHYDILSCHKLFWKE